MATDFNTHHLSVNELTAHSTNVPTMDHNDSELIDNDLDRGIDDYLNDDFRLNYSLNKIVLVNSASHAYSEILTPAVNPVDLNLGDFSYAA